MTKINRSFRVLCAPLVISFLLSGCVMMRSTIDVPIPQAQLTSGKAFIKLSEVRDLRRFEAAPRNPSVPSLQDAEEIKDRSITSRAIGRKRGGFGQALADVLLPEGRTVEQLVRAVVTRAANERGYSVVDQKSPEFEKALPLHVDIQQFWGWFMPQGFAQVSLEFESILSLEGAVVTGNRVGQVRGSSSVRGITVTDNDWQEVIKAGIADLIEKLRANLKPAH